MTYSEYTDRFDKMDHIAYDSKEFGVYLENERLNLSKGNKYIPDRQKLVRKSIE